MLKKNPCHANARLSYSHAVVVSRSFQHSGLWSGVFSCPVPDPVHHLRPDRGLQPQILLPGYVVQGPRTPGTILLHQSRATENVRLLNQYLGKRKLTTGRFLAEKRKRIFCEQILPSSLIRRFPIFLSGSKLRWAWSSTRTYARHYIFLITTFLSTLVTCLKKKNY